MAFLANENILAEATRELREKGFDLAWVLEEDQGASGERVLKVAHTEERVLATFDKDFGDLVFHRGAEAPAGVILLRIRPQSPGFMSDALRTSLQSDRVC